MARLGSDEDILELRIQCRACSKTFNSLLPPGHEDLAITCPFCSRFALAVIEDFSLNAGTAASSGAPNSLYKKKRYRV